MSRQNSQHFPFITALTLRSIILLVQPQKFNEINESLIFYFTESIYLIKNRLCTTKKFEERAFFNRRRKVDIKMYTIYCWTVFVYIETPSFPRQEEQTKTSMCIKVQIYQSTNVTSHSYLYSFIFHSYC